MRLFIVFSFILSISALAKRQPCITHGQCQLDHPLDYGRRCLIVKTGMSAIGKVICELRCYNVPLAYLCHKKKVDGVRNFAGKCRPERYKVPSFDMQDPNRCEIAVDPDEIQF